MSNGYQVFVDARGDLSAANGVVIDRGTGDVFEVGNWPAETGVIGNLAASLDEGVEIPRIQGATLLGGSGRNVLVTGLGEPLDGVYRPERPGFWRQNIFLLEVTGPSAATITDETDVVAILSAGGTAPVGSYVATTHGEDTYNASATFTLVAVGETGFPGTPNDIEVEVLAGTAQGGSYTSTDGINYVSAIDADWTLILNSDGTADFYYDGTAVASRAAGLAFDPCGRYVSTTAGLPMNAEFPDIEEGDPGDVNPFGTLVLVFSWPATPDLDIGVEFLGETVGYGYSASAPYMTWSGDDTGASGDETVTIDLAAAWDDGMISDFADVLAAVDWYPPRGGSGPASLAVTYNGGTPVNYVLHPGNIDTPAVTPAVAIRVLADGTAEPVGSEWVAVVRAVRKAPMAGLAYLAITEAAGVVTAAEGPLFASALPSSGGGVTYFPFATSDGDGRLVQLHEGALVW